MEEPTLPGLRVLLLENDPRDAELIETTLQDADPRCSVRVVDDAAGFRRALEEFKPDVVLSEHAVSDLDADHALRLVQELHPESPFLLVSRAYEATASQCLKGGAADFVPKAQLARLPHSIRTALSVVAPFRRLSDRQRVVLRFLATGASTRDIASRLGLSAKTVETHRSHLMKRLGVRDLASLVRFAVRVGVVRAGD